MTSLASYTITEVEKMRAANSYPVAGLGSLPAVKVYIYYGFIATMFYHASTYLLATVRYDQQAVGVPVSFRLHSRYTSHEAAHLYLRHHSAHLYAKLASSSAALQAAGSSGTDSDEIEKERETVWERPANSAGLAKVPVLLATSDHPAVNLIRTLLNAPDDALATAWLRSLDQLDRSRLKGGLRSLLLLSLEYSQAEWDAVECVLPDDTTLGEVAALCAVACAIVDVDLPNGVEGDDREISGQSAVVAHQQYMQLVAGTAVS